MGYTRPSETTKSYLEAMPLPSHGKSYTVIPHKEVISNTLNMLNASGFHVTREIYRANMNANVAQGIYHIVPRNPMDVDIQTETELGMMFAWTNSYDKSTRFQCAIGGYVMVCHNGMVAGDMLNFKRKHTGTADHDIKMQISNQIKNAEKYYKRIINDRDGLRQVPLTKRDQSELLGRLYADEEILEISQMSIVKSEMEKPSYNYNADQENAWAFYNHVTHALKKSHPKTWLSDTQKFHEFMVNDLLGQMGILQKDNPKTNQIDLFSELAINETEVLDHEVVTSEFTL
jgi:D-Tyr-tRNAtyr deacylase